MRLQRGRWSALACALTLAACASTPPATGTDDLLTGRLGVVVEGQADRSFSAGFELSGDARQGRLALTSPIGLKVGEARWRGNVATLSSSDGERRYDSLEALADDLMGETIPIEALFDWMRGRPWPQAAATPLPSPRQGFSQLGWEVDTTRASEGSIAAVRQNPPPRVTVRTRLDTR